MPCTVGLSAKQADQLGADSLEDLLDIDVDDIVEELHMQK
eukprot:COSAG01_NODE_34908_length_540_cov_0.938776_1_plen_39_part_10